MCSSNAGKLELTDITFKNERHLLRIIDKIVSAVGRRVDESNPYCDARLVDGSRFNCMAPPSRSTALVSIRKFKGKLASPIWCVLALLQRKWAFTCKLPFDPPECGSCRVARVRGRPPR